MKPNRRSLSLLLLSLSTASASAGDDALAALLAGGKSFLAEQAAQAAHAVSADATVSVELTPPTSPARFAACRQYNYFLPAGARLRGDTTLGVRCSAPARWSAFLRGRVRILGPYLVSARRLERGRALTDGDLALRAGDHGELPASTLSALDQALGRQLNLNLAAGQALRREHLAPVTLIRQGDRVKVFVVGGGFTAGTEGVALQNAGPGETLRVRTGAGKSLIGKARAAGEVEVTP